MANAREPSGVKGSHSDSNLQIWNLPIIGMTWQGSCAEPMPRHTRTGIGQCKAPVPSPNV